MAEQEVAAVAASDGHAHLRRAHSDTELLDEQHEVLSPLSPGNTVTEALGSAAFFAEDSGDDGNGLDKLDFTDQFGGHFLERLTDLWTRAYLSRQNDIDKLKQKLKIDKIAAGSQELRRRIQTNAKKHSARINKVLKVEEFSKMTKETPFLRTKDKVSFMLGIFLLMLTEYVLLVQPNQLHYVYTILTFPLLIARFALYHKAKWHYFMLDFCYYCQIVTMFCLYILPQNEVFFRITFALTNGPLLMAVIAWSNSLVFHDIDKLTSLWIHIYPPLVMFCERWYAREIRDTSFSFTYTMVVPVFFYILWQVFYSLKTEVLDKHKLANDKDMITSAKWLGEIRPHPVYVWLHRRGYKWSASIVLPGFQLFYTIGTLIPALFAYHFFWVHAGLLLLAFGFAAWYGAAYYFEVFSMNYSKRLQKQMVENNPDADPDRTSSDDSHYGPSSCFSVASFIFFFILFMSCFLSMIAYFCS